MHNGEAFGIDGMRIALLNLRFSPNLGDVLLCECLEYGLRRQAPGLDVVQIDITGRRTFAGASPRRLPLLAIVQRLPRWARQTLARVFLGRSLRRARPYWATELAKVDAAILGGGHLLADADLNFPLKVAAIFEAVSKENKRAGVHAVGVSDNWTPAGEALFRSALKGPRLVYASVRDEQSAAIWNRRLGPVGVMPAKVVRDPGLLSVDCYPAPPRHARGPARIGVCISHPVGLRYHADEPILSLAEHTRWFTELVKSLSLKGCSIYLFTTGSPEDAAYLERLAPSLTAAGAPSFGKVEVGARPATAADMAQFIATLDLVLAHRLHACVAAYSYGVPHIGFAWDQKMRGFFGSVGRSRYIVSAVSTAVPEIIRLAEETMREGVNEQERQNVIAEAYAELKDLLSRVASP